MARLIYDFFSYFVPAAFRADNVQHMRAVIWVAVVAFNTACTLFGFLYVEFGLSGVEGSDNMLGRILILFTLATYLIARIFFYWLHMLKTAGHLVTFGLFSATLTGVILTGGYAYSSMPVLLIIPATLAFIMMGMKPGMFWALVTVIALLGLWKMEQLDLISRFQIIHSKSIANQLAVLVPLSTAVMVIGGMMIYETIAIQLQNTLKNERNKFLWEATHDSLTGLPNRSEFYHRLKLGMRNAQLTDQALALVYMDLDGFKPVNDTHGHYIGDEVLKVVSQRLQDVFRGSDTVSRLGGDEFAIIFQGINTNEELMKNILEKTLKTISDEITIDGKTMKVGASMGVAYYSSQGTKRFSDAITEEDVKELCRRADIALYQAKASKNTWCAYINDTPYHGVLI